MRLFHRTDHAAAILNEGFKDGVGRYMTDRTHRGIWLSTEPLDSNEGASGDHVLEVYVPDDVACTYEWVEEVATYREFLVPAEVLNRCGPPRLLTTEEVEAAPSRFDPQRE